MELFPQRKVVGIFRGFTDGGLEFHADITLPYSEDLRDIPMHGQFVLGQLETPEEAVLGRITSISADGKLTSVAGEQYSIRSVADGREVPDNLREAYLRYRVDIRLLGVLRNGDADGTLVFVPSHRRLPHVGSKVAFLSDEVLKYVAGDRNTGAKLGYLAFGEYIYSTDENEIEVSPWMRIKDPAVNVRFAIDNLVSRRSFVFARAGFGKSNLNKLLFSTLYHRTPTVQKRGQKQVPVGTIIFDPDGEYFWPDDKGRPGFCDVPHLREHLVVFTSRSAPSPFYGSFVAGGVKLDIRRFRPSDVISIAIPVEKQSQQNIRKLLGLGASSWSDLVDLVDEYGNSASLDKIKTLLNLEEGQDMEALAARANMTTIVQMLHDKSSTLIDVLMESLYSGKLCVVDVSQLRGGPSLILSGLILRRIFDRNQEEFTAAAPRTIPTIAVVEEAQTVLNGRHPASAPYIEWVKEGRKYDLGAVLITQQPGSIPNDILSQGDNWFLFHLLSKGDLQCVEMANSHFSKDLLSSLLNEPIPGNGIFWSSAGETPYPIPFRGLSFESRYQTIDPYYEKPEVVTYARSLKQERETSINSLLQSTQPGNTSEVAKDATQSDHSGVDILALQKENAISKLKSDSQLDFNKGVAWGTVKAKLKALLPNSLDDKDTVAYHLVRPAVTQLLGGDQDVAWKTEKRGPNMTTYIIKL